MGAEIMVAPPAAGRPGLHLSLRRLLRVW
jgi:hypothetical protein